MTTNCTKTVTHRQINFGVVELPDKVRDKLENEIKLKGWAECARGELNDIDERECSKEVWDLVCHAKAFLHT